MTGRTNIGKPRQQEKETGAGFCFPHSSEPTGLGEHTDCIQAGQSQKKAASLPNCSRKLLAS